MTVEKCSKPYETEIPFIHFYMAWFGHIELIFIINIFVNFFAKIFIIYSKKQNYNLYKYFYIHLIMLNL